MERSPSRMVRGRDQRKPNKSGSKRKKREEKEERRRKNGLINE
jgi:hypothetical protein